MSFGRTSTCFLVGICFALRQIGAQADDNELSAKDDVVQRFERMANWVFARELVKKTKPYKKSEDGFRFSRYSELHIEFQLGATRLENEKDGAALFPIKATSLSRKYDSRRQERPELKERGDLQRVKLTVRGLLSEGDTPKAKITDFDPKREFKISHVTNYDAEQLIRDEIHRAIRWYLPEVLIEGRQKYLQKKLEIKNATDESIWVSLHRRTRVRGEKGYQWKWLPNEPGKGAAYDRILVRPKTTHALKVKVAEIGEINLPTTPLGGGGKIDLPDVERPVVANRVRVWAESESGQRWEECYDRNLWLVTKNPRIENDRAYYAEEMETYTHTIKPKTGTRYLTERVVLFRNETDDELTVDLQFRSNLNGVSKWRSRKAFRIQPGKTVLPLYEDMRMRAAAIKFSAEGENVLFERHKSEPLWLVEEFEGKRVYRGEEIGRYTHVFKLADERPGR